MVGLVSWSLNARLTVIVFSLIPILTFIAMKYGEAIRQLRSRTRVSESNVSAFTLQVLKSTPLIQAYQTGPQNSSQFVRLSEDSIAHFQRHQLYTRLLQLKGGAVGAVATALILFIGSLDVRSGTLSVGGLVLILNYVNQIRHSCNSLFANFSGIKSLEASVDRLFDLFDAVPTVEDPLDPAPLPQRGIQGEIIFDQVTYRYPDGTLALDCLDLQIHPGETVAIVGRTGAGKSTLVGLLLRFLDPTEGRVLIDGIDVRRLALADLRSLIAYVPQQPLLAPMSVAANIAYSQACWDEREVIRAVRESCADDFIQRLPKGIHTLIGEGSTRLSGGQKQRISLARALYRQTPILILDEPSSALDTLTEADLMTSLTRVKRGRTVVMVAHRLSTLRLADRIVVIERGRVAEQGTHQELIASRGLYHRFHEASRTVGDGDDIKDNA
jgi:ABC-type multidrug transport system fused ATPase/permease subunit